MAREAKLTNSTVSVYLHGSCLHMRRAIVLRIIAGVKRAEAEELERIEALVAVADRSEDR